ncbi:tripartite tricarboxylate transporter permease [Candidatus Pacearchaeota archaeon]|nr:tripartite tricarboxylate transporter permease [Candidatus Pacearchaeota archaeon]
MLIQFLISIIAGIVAGTITGLIPGIHINLVGTILISLSLTILSKIDSIYLAVFITAVAITHTFVDFIPSIFLGCPDTETELSILPGHELLKDGRGYEAVMLAVYGGLAAVFLLPLLAFPLSFLFSNIYDLIVSKMFWILLITFSILIFTEKRKFAALFVFLISGLFGLCALNLELNEPLLPMLTGLFGSSLLILSIKNKTQIPEQKISSPGKKIIKPVLSSVIASPLCGFLPGLGSGQAAVLGNLFSKGDKERFLTLIGSTNILVMGFSFISLYAISKTRTGAAAAVKEILGNLSGEVLILILLAILISGIISFFVTKFLAGVLSKKITRIDYSKLSIATLIFLIIIVFAISGFLGLLVLIASTLLGIFCNSLNVKKTNMMGCLLLPTIIYYFPF